MNRTKKKALNVLKKWVEVMNKDLAEVLDKPIKVEDFVAGWVLEDDSAPLRINNESEYGELLYNYYSEDYERYEFGVDVDFVELLAKKGLRPSNVNAAEFEVYAN